MLRTVTFSPWPVNKTGPSCADLNVPVHFSDNTNALLKGLLAASASKTVLKAGLLANWNPYKYEYNLKSHTIHADTLCGRNVVL
jgi:hypothetical protein